MLNLYLNVPIVDKRVSDFEAYFDDVVDDIDFDTPIIQVIINEIDKPIKYYGKARWEGRVIGVIGPQDLSGGSKALICSYYWPDLIFPTIWLGNNCAHALHLLSNVKDINWSLYANGFKFDDDQMINVVAYNKIVKGCDIYKEIKSHGDFTKIMQDIQFQVD